MENFLIIDTEGAYNLGLLVFNQERIINSKQLVIKENFENRNLCGIETYNRKKSIFEKQKDVQYVTAGEALTVLQSFKTLYNIKSVFGQNIQVDRTILDHLYTQAKPYVPLKNDLLDFNYVNTIKILKILYPKNPNTGLESAINDILGTTLRQRHTGYDDCYWLYTILTNLCEYLEILSIPEFLDNVNDEAFVECIKALSSRTKISGKQIFEKIPEAKRNYTVKTINSRLENLTKINLLTSVSENNIGVNGNILKTTTLFYTPTPQAKVLFSQFSNFILKQSTIRDKIREKVPEMLMPFLSEDMQEELRIFQQSVQKKVEEQNVEKLNKEKSKLAEDFKNKKEILYKEIEEKNKEFEKVKKEFYKPAFTFYSHLNDKAYVKTHKKELKELEKQLKKSIIDISTYIEKVINLK